MCGYFFVKFQNSRNEVSVVTLKVSPPRRRDLPRQDGPWGGEIRAEGGRHGQRPWVVIVVAIVWLCFVLLNVRTSSWVGQTNKYLACECSEDPTLFRSTVYARCHEECLVTSDRNVPTRTALDHEFFPSLKCFFNIDNFLISDGILQSQFRGMLLL